MSFLRQFLVYGMGGAATRLAAIVLVPLYTRTLSVPEYGRLEILLAVHALTLILAGMQLESSVARDFHEARLRGESAQLVWSTVWLTAAGAAAVAVLMAATRLGGWLPVWFGARTLVLLILLTFPAQMLGVQQVMLRFAGRSVAFATLSFCDLAGSAALSAWFIVGLNGGVDGALMGMLAGKLICVTAAWPITFGRAVRVSLRGEAAKKVLAYGVPSIPAVLIGWIQNAGSRLLLAVALTLSDVAIGGIAIKVAAIYSFIVYSFRLAWEPFAFARLRVFDEDPGVFCRTLEWYVATMFLVAGMAAVLSPQIVRVLAPPAYAISGTIAVLFLIGQFWVGMTNVLAIGIHGARRTSLLLPVYGYGAVVNVAILFTLARSVGVAAAGLGFLAGSICSAFLARHYSNKHFNTGFTLRLMVWTTTASLGFGASWYALAANFHVRGSAAAWQLFALGAALVLAALAVIARAAVAPGRGLAMWTDIVGLVRRHVALR